MGTETIDRHILQIKLRWKIFIAQWEKALSEDKEVIVTGDINIDSLKWMKDNQAPNDSTYKKLYLLGSLNR